MTTYSVYPYGNWWGWVIHATGATGGLVYALLDKNE